AWENLGSCLHMSEGTNSAPRITTRFFNNVCHQADESSDAYVTENPIEARKLFEHNVFVGGRNGGIPASASGTITEDPQITVDIDAYTPVVIAESSPLIGAGTNDVSDVVTNDFFGRPRTDGYDIGAVQSSD
ncbi:MAG: hypothetical protein AAF645_03770, partial [Myxococcota bacterium]